MKWNELVIKSMLETFKREYGDIASLKRRLTVVALNMMKQKMKSLTSSKTSLLIPKPARALHQNMQSKY